MATVLKIFKWFLLIMSLSICLIFLGFTNAVASTNLTVSPTANSDASKAIQAKLNEAKVNATTSNPYIITVAKGSYNVSTALHIYSNTTLVLTGVTLTRSESNINIVKIGENDDKQKGYYYQNIKIIGGVLDGKNIGGTVVKFGHGKNISLINATIKNVKDAHLMEVAGIYNLIVEGCTFKNQLLSSSNSMPQPEALQLDILSQRHMRGYLSEDLPLKDVTVTKCVFENVPRGVGSHTAIVNNPIDGITISDNVFSNIHSGAIHGLNYINCLISGNKINASPRGIVLYSMFEKGVHFGSTLASEGGVKTSTPSIYKKPLSNQNIIIRNNEINVKGKDTYFKYESDGIYLAGLTLTKSLSKASDHDAINKGDYFISGAKVYNNVIKTSSHGVRFRDVRKSQIENNRITYIGKKSQSNSHYGIQLTKLSKKNAVSKNRISKMATNGIYINEKSSASLISNNKIALSGKYGIAVEQSTVDLMSGNVINKSANNGIHIFRSAKIKIIKGNKITSAKANAMNIDQKSLVTKIVSNTIDNPKQSGILVHNKATVKSVSLNKLSKCGDKGIGVYSAKAKTLITKNTISKSKNYGIYVDVKNTNYKIIIKGNKLQGAGKSEMVKVVSGKVTVSGSSKAK